MRSEPISEGTYQESTGDPPPPRELVKAQPITRPQEQLPQYVQGFEGLATEPFPQAARDILGAKVNPEEVEIKPDGIVYLSHVAYRRILTRSFGAGGWALAPRSPARTMGNLVVYHGALYALGRFVSEAVGECNYHPNNESMSYASALEGARSDCLTRCCKDLGVATELWDKTWREWWQKNYAVCEWKEAKTGKWAGQKRPHWTKKGADQKGAEAPAARNVGGNEEKPAPKAETVTSARRSTDVTAAKSTAPGVTTSRTTAPVSSAAASQVAEGTAAPTTSSETTDIGEAASYEEQQAVRNAAKAINWAPQRAGAWLKKHFGVPTTGALTKKQAADVMMCLLAAAKGEQAYRDTLAVLVVEKRARP